MKSTYLSVHCINRPIAAKNLLFTAIRTAYSAERPFDNWVGGEFKEYEAKPAADGKGGTEADRLIRHIVKMGHTSTLEHLNFTFVISGVSRALLAQLTRHRIGVSPTVQSQRYVDDKTKGKKGGVEMIVPPSIENNAEAWEIYNNIIFNIQTAYDQLRALGIPKEDARFVLPNGASTSLTLTMNLRAILHLWEVRHEKGGAQWEIKDFTEAVVDKLISEEPWLEYIFKPAE